MFLLAKLTHWVIKSLWTLLVFGCYLWPTDYGSDGFIKIVWDLWTVILHDPETRETFVFLTLEIGIFPVYERKVHGSSVAGFKQIRECRDSGLLRHQSVSRIEAESFGYVMQKFMSTVRDPRGVKIGLDFHLNDFRLWFSKWFFKCDGSSYQDKRSHQLNDRQIKPFGVTLEQSHSKWRIFRDISQNKKSQKMFFFNIRDRQNGPQRSYKHATIKDSVDYFIRRN